MRKLHIFISYTTTGMGHKTPALAIAESIENLYPKKFQITTSNFFKDAGETEFNKYIDKSWDWLLKHPGVTHAMIIFGKVAAPLSPFYMRILQRKVWNRSINYMKAVNPDIVLTTHFFTQTIAIDTRKRFHLNYPIIAFNPDTFETFPQWDKRGDLLLVCSTKARNAALKLGHHSEKIKIVPQALRQEFDLDTLPDRNVLKLEYQIRPDIFTILMSDGGQGVGNMLSSIKLILRLRMPVNIIAVCGKNPELFKRLTHLSQRLDAQNHPVRLKVFGFVDSMSPLIVMSDLFIGKSGPASVMECLKMNCPVVVNFSASSAEKSTAKFFKKLGVVWICLTPFKLLFTLRKLLLDPTHLDSAKQKLQELDHFHNGSSIIAKITVDMLEESVLQKGILEKEQFKK